MKDTDKLVSIFVPYYNDSAFLCDCIDSILNQSYEKFELILLDHASTDSSVEIAQSYTDQRIRHISLPRNLGAGGGVLLNEFLNVAQGDFVKLFCADDVMCPDCIASLVEYMQHNPHVDVVFGNIQYIDEHLKSLKDDWFSNRQDFNINDGSRELLYKFSECKSFLPYIGSFARREAFADIKLNKTFIMVFDMSLWVEMLLNDRSFAFLDKIVASYRIHKGQASSVRNLKNISAYSLYEELAYLDIFYSYAKNIDILRKICSGSSFLNCLGEEDNDLFEFVVAHYFLVEAGRKSTKIKAYLKLEKILSDDCLRSKIETKFSYGIAEFRRDYSTIQPVSFKKKIYEKRPNDLNIGEITFLLFRSVWDILSLKKIRKKKRYTV